MRGRYRLSVVVYIDHDRAAARTDLHRPIRHASATRNGHRLPRQDQHKGQ